MKFDLECRGRCLAHLNLISSVLVDGCFTLNLISTLVDDWFTQILSRPSWSMSGSRKLDLGSLGRFLAHLTWSQPPWLMAESPKFYLDRLGRCLAHLNLISAVLVHWWFTETWCQPPLLMTGSLKFDLDGLGQWLAQWNLISTTLVMAGSLKFDLDSLGRCLVHWNLISAVSVDFWLILNLTSTALVDGWLTEIWSRLS